MAVSQTIDPAPDPLSILTEDELADLRMLTLDQVAELWGVSRMTIVRMIRAGELRPISVWGKRRLSTREVRRFIDERDGSRPRQRRPAR